MNLTQFQQQLAQTLQFVEQLNQQNPSQPISALDKDTLAARLRELYAMLVFDNPQPVSYAQPVVQPQLAQEPAQELILETPQPEPAQEPAQELILETPEPEPVQEPAQELILETPQPEPAQEPAINEVVFELPAPQPEPKNVSEKVSFEIVNDEAVFETQQAENQAVVIENPQVVENQENTLVVVNNSVQSQNPTNEETGVVVTGFSMVAQKNNEVTIRNQAIYDANEAAMRSNSAFRSEYDELFEFKAATELSQKLSETKIEDLNKAMGLNEKFFFINELFGGNSKKFKDCMEFLNNNAKSMEDAREYLEKGIMDEHHWLNPKRKGLCKDFLKTVRRRYLK